MSTSARDAEAAASAIADQAKAAALPLGGVLLFMPVGLDVAQVQRTLAAKLPGVPFLGMTSCLGQRRGRSPSTRRRWLAWRWWARA